VEVELEVAHARTMSQVLAILTPEQKAQLAERRKQFEQKHREGEGRPDKAPGN
jgi:Spy/CpxP family protein refolding chaperone